MHADFDPGVPTTGRVRLRDGRVLAHAEHGDPGGRPVLLVPGAASGGLVTPGEGPLRHLGVRLVTVERPGLGASDPCPGATFTSVAEDLRELVASLGTGPVPCLAHSQGAPFGLAAAAAGVVSRLVLVSPADEVARPEFRTALPPGFAALVDLAARDPGRAYDAFAGFTAASMFELVLGRVAPADAATYGRGDFRAWFRRVLDDGFRQGPDAYARDTVLAVREWGLPLEAIAVPVEVWHGDLDGTHSPDVGATLAARVPGARHRVVAGAGGSLLWSHAEDVLRAALGPAVALAAAAGETGGAPDLAEAP
ncbi:alpha/beta fold hydrolase [Kineococcus esterisolvens]|uniref:alpha/beta fold hydrolase n=1 Tax=unclassified Kineococcus TaxID=2621656 RepID=UPI003D7E13DD